MLETARVEPSELEAFGRDLAELHARLPAVAPAQAWGRPAEVRAIILRNLAQCVEVAAVFATTAAIEALRVPLEAALNAAEPWVTRRRAAGHVRECHGDLYTRNIVRHDARLVAFDCMEFEPAFRWTDVADELALLLCDLQARDRPAHAQAFLGGYLAQSGDYQACRVLNPYKVHRALVRAKVVALSAAEAADDAARRLLRGEHLRLVACAADTLAKRGPRLVLMCGMSGSGKTWLAALLACQLGAVHLRSDVERKRRAGLPEFARSGSGVGAGLYSSDTSATVYQHLAGCAEDVLGGDHAVIVDATFSRRDDRARFHVLATQLGLDPQIVWCVAPADVLRARVRDRLRRAADASEAPAPDEGFGVVRVDTTDPQATDHVLWRLSGMSGAGQRSTQ